MKLLTLGDGIGDSKAVPDWYPGYFKWPDIIQLMTRDVELINLSKIGAGNEYLTQCLRANITDKDAVLIQWCVPERLDLVLAHTNDFWIKQINNEPIYNSKSIVEIDNDRYWLSSGSLNTQLEHYRNTISMRQHQLRSQIFIDYAKLLLEQHGVNYGFFLTRDGDYLNQVIAETSRWFWHDPFKGIQSFKLVSQFAELDQQAQINQPTSLTQFDFIKQFIMPNFDLNWRNNKDINAVENMLYRKFKEALVNKHDSH